MNTISELSLAIGILNGIAFFLFICLTLPESDKKGENENSTKELKFEKKLYLFMTGLVTVLDCICFIMALFTHDSIFLPFIGMVIWAIFFVVAILDKE